MSMSHSSHQKHNHDTRTATTNATAGGPGLAEPSQAAAERIRSRAFEICQARNGGPGDALTDWAQAESELRAQPAAKR